MQPRTPPGFKHVVSVSLGSSKRNAREHTTLLGQPFVVERIGTDGDKRAAARLFAELDGRVDALGLGGADLHVVAAGRRYTFAGVQRLVAGARHTPVLDGSGVKNTLERRAVAQLADSFDWPGQRVLMVSALDRFGMAEAFEAAGAQVLYGDVVFGLGLPLPLRRARSLARLARLALPVITWLPQDWFYPTGAKQERSVSGAGTRHYAWADVLAGDTHFIKRYAPDDLWGKAVLTQTVTADDREWMRLRGVSRLVTTTPQLGGRNFATNVLEAMLVALDGSGEALSEGRYLELIAALELKPQVTELRPG